MSLYTDFKNNKERKMCKWLHYFPVYEKHFSQWKNRSLTFLEVGVSTGGSLQMWAKYFGPLATIVGIDTDGRCAGLEDLNVHVRLGDQSNTEFLDKIINEFGIPDIVLDDGSHQQEHIKTTFKHLYPKMHKNAIYAVEDLHTAYWSEYQGGLQSASFINCCKDLIDTLNADHSRGSVKSNDFTKTTFGIHFYDSVVVFEKGEIKLKKAVTTGVYEYQ